MILAKVKGNIVATQKDSHLVGHKLLIVQPVDLKGEFLPSSEIVAIDLTGAGTGETVLVTQEGDAVQQILGHNKAPVNTIIVGIVDSVDVEG